jgi:hypothetical protein
MDDLARQAELSAGVTEELRRELFAQYEEISGRIGELRDRAKLLQRLADQAREQADADERLLNELAGGLGLACQLRIEQLDRRLRGLRLQEIAIEILVSKCEPGETVHYRQWFEWICEAGFSIQGKDPLATFLAQVRRSPRVASVGSRSGLYRLRMAA